MALPIPSDPEGELTSTELRAAWPVLSEEERVDGFRALRADQAQDFFTTLQPHDLATLLLGLPSREQRLWLRQLDPDDAVDVVQEVPAETREALVEQLDASTRRDVLALLAYQEDAAGGLMSPRFARVRPDASCDEAIRYLRQQARDRLETIYYAYVLDATQRLLGVASFRDLFTAPPEAKVRDVMETEVVTVPETLDQEAVARVMARTDLMAVPVVDDAGRMKGIITVDDIVDVVQEEATEDIQKLGGTEVLVTPYLRTGLFELVRKRIGWLAILFLGEMLTASALDGFEAEIARAPVLTVFIALIISSGGNSGSQTATLVIRAMALNEVRLKDWWRVARRELASGVILGAALAAIGYLRVVGWQALFGTYGEHAALLALTLGGSLLAVVTWGTIVGSMLPFLLRAARLDPATASVPFVATLVDVVGLVLYFTIAQATLAGTLL